MKCATFKTLVGSFVPFALGIDVLQWAVKLNGTFVYFGFSGVHVYDKLPQTVQ